MGKIVTSGWMPTFPEASQSREDVTASRCSEKNVHFLYSLKSLILRLPAS